MDSCIYVLLSLKDSPKCCLRGPGGQGLALLRAEKKLREMTLEGVCYMSGACDNVRSVQVESGVLSTL